MLKDIIYSTSVQKVLYFLLSNPYEMFYDREVSRLSGVSKAGTNFALHDLLKAGLVEREKKGRMYFYRIDLNKPIMKYFKIMKNLIDINSLVEELKKSSIRIVLYGSASKGENHKNSDLDLFIVTKESNKIKNIIYQSPLREKIQYIIKKPQELAKLKKDNAVFLNEILTGIVLYEGK